MTLPASSARRETRLELEETVFIEVLNSTSGEPGAVILCNSLDFSASGLQVVVDEDLEVGGIFRLCLDLQDEEPIFLAGEVKWKRPDDESAGFRLGFTLFDSEDTDIKRWQTLIARMIADKA